MKLNCWFIIIPTNYVVSYAQVLMDCVGSNQPSWFCLIDGLRWLQPAKCEVTLTWLIDGLHRLQSCLMVLPY